MVNELSRRDTFDSFECFGEVIDIAVAHLLGDAFDRLAAHEQFLDLGNPQAGMSGQPISTIMTPWARMVW